MIDVYKLLFKVYYMVFGWLSQIEVYPGVSLLRFSVSLTVIFILCVGIISVVNIRDHALNKVSSASSNYRKQMWSKKDTTISKNKSSNKFDKSNAIDVKFKEC